MSEAGTVIEGEPRHGIGKIEFERVDDFTTFTAEFTQKGDDIIVHFFLPRPNAMPLEAATESSTPEEVQAAATRAVQTQNLFRKHPAVYTYWTKTFPAALDPVVRRIFKVEPPRVQAAYTEEIASWWFIARGFLTLDPKAVVLKLFTDLDQSLDALSPPDVLGLMTSST